MRNLLLSALLISTMGCDSLLGIEDHTWEQDAGQDNFDRDSGIGSVSHAGGTAGQLARTTGGIASTTVGATSGVSVGGISSVQAATGTVILPNSGGTRAADMTTAALSVGGAPIVLPSGGTTSWGTGGTSNRQGTGGTSALGTPLHTQTGGASEIIGPTRATGGRSPVGGTYASGGTATGGARTSSLPQNTGGFPATGGLTAVTGGRASTGGARGTGGAPASGGIAATGGNLPATGGSPPATGGAPATGGNPAVTGGSPPATGGAESTGGSEPGTGGSPPATGGSPPATGGAASTGGSLSVTGGAPATGGTSATTAIQQVCSDTCAIVSDNPDLSKCKLKSCKDDCAALYEDTGVLGVVGCQDAYLETLQCGATQSSSSWTCDLGLPMPTGSLSCLVPVATLVALPGCSDSLAAAAGRGRD